MLTHNPSTKSMKSMREKIKLTLRNTTCNDDIINRIRILNRKLTGFRNYYSMRYANKWLYKIDWYVIIRFTIWDNYKRKRKHRFSRIDEIRKVINNLGIVKMVI